MSKPEKSDALFMEFEVPLKIPNNSQRKNDYLFLLYEVVDNLGKEVFESDLKLLESTKISESILNLENDRERLNALLECSPLVMKKWQKFFPFVEDNEDYEMHLFIFIQTLRRKFLDTFFYIQDSDLEQDEDIAEIICLTPIKPNNTNDLKDLQDLNDAK
jgi:hypothetical protein